MEQLHQRAAGQARGALGDRRYAAAHAQGAGHAAATRLSGGPSTAPRNSSPPSLPGWRTPAALTKRELEIADMVASGLSNREIAARLFISRRTVDAHVEHIYGKLEISSRVQLTVWLQEQPRRARTATWS